MLHLRPSRTLLADVRQFACDYVRFQIDRGVDWWLHRYNGERPR
jgi:hypothetical protein